MQVPGPQERNWNSAGALGPRACDCRLGRAARTGRAWRPLVKGQPRMPEETRAAERGEGPGGGSDPWTCLSVVAAGGGPGAAAQQLAPSPPKAAHPAGEGRRSAGNRRWQEGKSHQDEVLQGMKPTSICGVSFLPTSNRPPEGHGSSSGIAADWSLTPSSRQHRAQLPAREAPPTNGVSHVTCLGQWRGSELQAGRGFEHGPLRTRLKSLRKLNVRLHRMAVTPDFFCSNPSPPVGAGQAAGGGRKGRMILLFSPPCLEFLSSSRSYPGSGPPGQGRLGKKGLDLFSGRCCPAASLLHLATPGMGLRPQSSSSVSSNPGAGGFSMHRSEAGPFQPGLRQGELPPP